MEQKKIDTNEMIVAARKEYAGAGREGKDILARLFGKEVFEAKVTDRIKTFEDALKELGEDNRLVKEYKAALNYDSGRNLRAYLKLRIVCAALNEGWVPKFTVDEYRYFPYYYLLTKKEYDALSDKEKENAVFFGGYAYYDAGGGLAYAHSLFGFSPASAYYGSRLCLKNRELAVYCGKQFIKIWADYLTQ